MSRSILRGGVVAKGYQRGWLLVPDRDRARLTIWPLSERAPGLLHGVMAQPCTWVLTFDVAHPRRLRRLSKFLEQRAQRVQRSVFELLATPEALGSLLTQATVPERFDASRDGLRVYRLCEGCQAQVRLRGVGPALRTARGPLVFP
jgi:CRISPR-associated protein Cas2